MYIKFMHVAYDVQTRRMEMLKIFFLIALCSSESYQNDNCVKVVIRNPSYAYRHIRTYVSGQHWEKSEE